MTTIDHSKQSLQTMLPTCCDAVASRYRYEKGASSATSLRDCYIRAESSLRSGYHTTMTPLDLINEESRAPQPALRGRADDDHFRPLKRSHPATTRITARYCAAAVRATRVDTQTGRKELRIFLRPLYVQAIDAERGDIMIIRGEDRTEPFARNLFCAPILWMTASFFPQETCARLGPITVQVPSSSVDRSSATRIKT